MISIRICIIGPNKKNNRNAIKHPKKRYLDHKNDWNDDEDDIKTEDEIDIKIDGKIYWFLFEFKFSKFLKDGMILSCC